MAQQELTNILPCQLLELLPWAPVDTVPGPGPPSATQGGLGCPLAIAMVTVKWHSDGQSLLLQHFCLALPNQLLACRLACLLLLLLLPLLLLLQLLLLILVLLLSLLLLLGLLGLLLELLMLLLWGPCTCLGGSH